MSTTRVQDMIAWLRAHPDEPFRTVYDADGLLVGTRNDEGELHAWACTVNDEAFVMDRRPTPDHEGK